MRIFLFILLLIVVAVLGVTFSTQNSGSVDLKYYDVFSRTVPIAGLVFSTLVIGFVLGWLFRTLSVVKASSRARRAERKLTRIEKEVEDLRPATPKDEVI